MIIAEHLHHKYKPRHERGFHQTNGRMIAAKALHFSLMPTVSLTKRCPPLACLLLLIVSLTAAAEETLEGYESQIEAANQALQKLDKEIAQSQRLKKQLQRSLSDVSERVGEREQRLSNLKTDIAQYNSTLEKIEEQLELERSNMASRRTAMASSIRKMQRIAASSGLKVALQNDDPASADRHAIYTEYFVRAQNTAIATQLATLEKIQQAHANALKDRNWLNYIKKKATLQHDSYRTEQASKQRSIGEVEQTISSKTRSVATLKADQGRLQTLLEELKAAQVLRSGYFLSGQGQYGLPVKGDIQARFNEIKSVGKLRWTGIFIQASAGAPVRAIADGEVVYSGWLNGFGMLVILDHGDGFMTLYGGNRDVAVSPADWAESGATIATVGDSGGQKTSGVYFEIRHNAKPVDPEQWVSPKNAVVNARK